MTTEHIIGAALAVTGFLVYRGLFALVAVFARWVAVREREVAGMEDGDEGSIVDAHSQLVAEREEWEREQAAAGRRPDEIRALLDEREPIIHF